MTFDLLELMRRLSRIKFCVIFSPLHSKDCIFYAGNLFTRSADVTAIIL